jgi:thiol-disulfide isomerase/thioredoxin
VAAGLTLVLAIASIPRPQHSVDQTAPAADQEASVLYLYSPDCPDCQEVGQDVLPLLQDMGIEVVKIDVTVTKNIQRILEVERQYGVQFTTLAPNMIFDGRVLQGPDTIRREFLGEG